MKLYVKQINGKAVIKQQNQIVVRMGGRQHFCPKEEILTADGWVEYIEPIPSETELLNHARQRKLRDLTAYDESKSVNNCVIVHNGVELDYWATKDERDFLKGAVRDCISLGRETYRLDLRDKGISLNIPCGDLLMMLAVLEVYAIDCYNRTTDHEYALKALETKEEIEAYEFTGYPAQPRFSV